MFSLKSSAVLAVFGAVVLASASPVSLLPGQLVTPSYDYNQFSDIPGTFVTDMTSDFVGLDASSNVAFSGFLYSAILEQADGTLAFVYYAHNYDTSSDAIERLSVSSFQGFTTAVDGGDGSNPTWIQPTSDTRTSNGRVINFGFPVGSGFGAVAPGDESRLVVVFTNAKAYTSGSAGLIDGGSGNAATFAPVPEPATMSVLGLGALALVRRRRKA